MTKQTNTQLIRRTRAMSKEHMEAILADPERRNRIAHISIEGNVPEYPSSSSPDAIGIALEVISQSDQTKWSVKDNELAMTDERAEQIKTDIDNIYREFEAIDLDMLVTRLYTLDEIKATPLFEIFGTRCSGTVEEMVYDTDDGDVDSHDVMCSRILSFDSIDDYNALYLGKTCPNCGEKYPTSGRIASQMAIAKRASDVITKKIGTNIVPEIVERTESSAESSDNTDDTFDFDNMFDGMITIQELAGIHRISTYVSEIEKQENKYVNELKAFINQNPTDPAVLDKQRELIAIVKTTTHFAIDDNAIPYVIAKALYEHPEHPIHVKGFVKEEIDNHVYGECDKTSKNKKSENKKSETDNTDTTNNSSGSFSINIGTGEVTGDVPESAPKSVRLAIDHLRFMRSEYLYQKSVVERCERKSNTDTADYQDALVQLSKCERNVQKAIIGVLEEVQKHNGNITHGNAPDTDESEAEEQTDAIGQQIYNEQMTSIIAQLDEHYEEETHDDSVIAVINESIETMLEENRNTLNIQEIQQIMAQVVTCQCESCHLVMAFDALIQRLIASTSAMYEAGKLSEQLNQELKGNQEVKDALASIDEREQKEYADKIKQSRDKIEELSRRQSLNAILPFVQLAVNVPIVNMIQKVVVNFIGHLQENEWLDSSVNDDKVNQIVEHYIEHMTEVPELQQTIQDITELL